jgi:hypothetical protein
MENYIKYKRFIGFYNEETLQKFFDELVKESWTILSYSEKTVLDKLFVIVVCGKKNVNL